MTAKEIIKIIKDSRNWHYRAYDGTLKDKCRYGSTQEHLLVVQVLDRILEEIGAK